MANPRCMNLSDPGTGKTPSVCVWFYWLWTDRKVRSAWAMPLSLLKKNRQEILDFTNFKPEDVVIVAGTAIQRAKQMASDAKVFLMGFDCFSTNWKMLPNDVNALAVDEIHMGYGTDGSGRTQKLYAAMEKLKYFLPMTGTLINGRLSSAYPCLKICSPDSYTSYDNFLMLHAVCDSYGC